MPVMKQVQRSFTLFTSFTSEIGLMEFCSSLGSQQNAHYAQDAYNDAQDAYDDYDDDYDDDEDYGDDEDYDDDDEDYYDDDEDYYDDDEAAYNYYDDSSKIYLQFHFKYEINFVFQ